MKHYCLLPLLFCALLAFGQSTVDMASDSHYTLLLENDQVRVFELSLSPAQQVYVRHDHNFLTITLQDCEVVLWGEGESAIQNFPLLKGDVRFAFGGHAYGIRNDRTTNYRSVTVEFLDPKVTNWGYQWQSGTWGYGPSGGGSPVDPHAKFISAMQLGDVTVNSVQLLSGDSYPAPGKPTARLLVPVTDVDLKADDLKTSGRGRHMRKAAGEALWFPAEQKSRFVNASSDPARFVVVEFTVTAP